MITKFWYFRMWEFELFSIITTTQKINLDIAIEFATEMGELTGNIFIHLTITLRSLFYKLSIGSILISNKPL